MSRAARRSMALPLPLLLAVRYLRSARRDAFASLLSALAAGGIAVGVAALILVLAALAGLQSFLREDVLARTPHVEIELPRGDEAIGGDAALDRLIVRLEAVDGVAEVRRLVRGRGWMILGESAVAAEIVGFEGVLPAFFPRTAEQQAAALTRGAFLGDDLVARWGLDAGTLVELVSPRPTLTPLGPRPRLVPLRIAGSYTTGRTERDTPRVAVPIEVARSLFGGRSERLELRARSFDEALEVADRAAAVVPEGALVRSWKDLNRALFFALQLERIAMFVSVFLIVPVAAMALITVLALLVSAKRGEIGMLHAMGAAPREIERAFFALGLLLGAAGLLAGLALGLGGAFVLDRFELLAPPGDLYLLDHIPFLVRGGDLAAALGATAAFTVLTTLYAARKASAMEPTEALRLP
ncbi:MAG: FtsX-like permease family protein [Acidobacteriota bacterium]